VPQLSHLGVELGSLGCKFVEFPEARQIIVRGGVRLAVDFLLVGQSLSDVCLGTSIAPQPRNFFFEKSTEIVHLTLQCSRQIAGRVWRVRVKRAGVISITVKPNRSRISLSAAFCD
jgi:hypothetical protein